VLAARLIRTLDCTQIAARLATGTDCLVSSIRNLPDRHRSLAASFNYSWALLSADEQRALGQLTVFAGPFSEEAADAVALATTASLHSLYDAGMLATTSCGRYYVPNLLRPYAARWLARQANEEQKVRLRHATYYTRLITRSLPSLIRSNGKQASIDQELPNMQAAWDWVLRSVRDETEADASGDIDGEQGLRELALGEGRGGRC
jgi:predicted ATPase